MSLPSAPTDIWPQPTVSRMSAKRDLPALPAPASQMRVSLYDAPVSRSNSPRSSLQTSSPARTPSPSIRNLGQRSVVKQRLAQIERTYSEESSQSGLTTPKYRSSYQRTSSPLTPLSTRREAPTMSRQGTIESAAGDSIIESYGNVGRKQSISRHSAKSCGRTQSGDSTPSHFHPREDLFSPASKYSTDEVTQPFGVPSRLHTITGLPMQESRSPLMYNLGGALAPQATPTKAFKPLPEPGLEDRLANLQQDIAILTSTRTETSAPKIAKQTEQALSNIQATVKGIEVQGTLNGQDLTVIRKQVGTILTEFRTHASANDHQQPSVGMLQVENISHKLEDLRTALANQLPELMKKVEMLGSSTDRPVDGQRPFVMQNLAPGGASNDSQAVDLGPVEEKLGQLLSLYQTMQMGNTVEGGQGSNEETKIQVSSTRTKVLDTQS